MITTPYEFNYYIDSYMSNCTKKKFAVYGNCQPLAVSQYLLSCQKFRETYDFINVSHVFYISENETINFLEKICPTLDLIIYVQVNDTFGASKNTKNIYKMISSKCIVITFPSCFFTGYAPDNCYIKINKTLAERLGTPIEYHNLEIVKSFLNNESVDECKKNRE